VSKCWIGGLLGRMPTTTKIAAVATKIAAA
jgi:hypothetical protein